jgi:hypothetical protein
MLAVELGCTALMIIASVRQVDLAAALVISDELFGEQWIQALDREPVQVVGTWLCQALARSMPGE